MLEKEIFVIHFLKSYYTLDDVLEVELQFNKSVEEFNFVKFQIAQIDAQSDYNNVICILTTDLKANELGSYKIRVKCDVLKEGLFFFCHFELLKQEKWDAEFPLKFDIYEIENIKQQYFKIRDKSNELEYLSINEEVKEINAIREKKFLKGIGDFNFNKFYTVYFFIKNIYLQKRFTYGQSEVIPFDKISTSNIYDFINRFISSEIGIKTNIEYDNNDRIQYENPGLVIFYPKVFAKDETEAYNIGEQVTENLLKAFSLTRNTKGEIISSLIFDLSSKVFFYTKPQIFTAKNIMSGEMFGENPFLNQEIVQLINKDNLFSLLTNLYNDAINENHVEIKYSKFWTILEVLAESKNYPNAILKKTYLNGTKFLKKNENSNPTIKDKVRELFRENLNFNNYLINLIHPQAINVDKMDDLLTIWYRHRNCMVHCGGCQPENHLVCKNSPDYILCKSKHLEILEKHLIRTVNNDTYLIFLEQATRCILINYFIHKTGFIDINEHFFMQLSAVPSIKFEKIEIEHLGKLEKIITGNIPG